jgi:hypothetical protein
MAEDRSLATARRRSPASQRADAALIARSRRQHGIFTIAQAIECGVPKVTIYRRAARGRYEPLWPGVFRVSGVPDTKEGRQLAVLLRYGGDATLARATAADVHGLEHRLPADGMHLLVRDRRFAAHPEIHVHRSLHLSGADVTEVGALRVTSVTWTLTDLAGLVEPGRLRKLVSAGVRSGRTDAARLRELLRRRGRFVGRAMLRRIVDELSPLERVTRSELESLFLLVTSRAGVPPSAMNHPVRDTNGERRELDAVYLPERLPVELDSRAFHGTLLDWNDDLRRENAVKLVGWRDPLRFTYADLRDRPDEVVEVLRAALARARE